MEVQLEMHVNEAPFSRSFILSDCDLARVIAFLLPLKARQAETGTQKRWLLQRSNMNL
jgi:hypothetical protein